MYRQSLNLSGLWIDSLFFNGDGLGFGFLVDRDFRICLYELTFIGLLDSYVLLVLSVRELGTD